MFPSGAYLRTPLNFLLILLLAFVYSTGHMESRVSQTPSHDVTEMGQSAVLRCEPISGHYALYWYRHTLEKGMEFLIYFYNKAPTEKADFFQDRFSANMSEDSHATLTIQPVQLGDSATYFCASSLDHIATKSLPAHA